MTKDKTTLTRELKPAHEYDFKTGIPVTSSEIKRWHDDAVKALIENPSQRATYIRSGNGLVMASRLKDEMNFEEIQVFEISNGYKHFIYELGISTSPDLLTKAVELLKEAQLQIEYLQNKFKETGTGNAVLSHIDSFLKDNKL